MPLCYPILKAYSTRVHLLYIIEDVNTNTNIVCVHDRCTHTIQACITYVGVYKCAFMLFVAKWCFQAHNSFARMRKCNMGIHKVCMTMNRRQNKNVVSIIQIYLHCFLNTNMFASCWSQFSKRKVQQNARSCEKQPTLLYSTLLYSTLLYSRKKRNRSNVPAFEKPNPHKESQ